MSLPDFHTRTAAPLLTKAEIAARIEASPMPDGWNRDDDVALMEGLFRGLGIAAIASQIDQRDGDVAARWRALKTAAGAEHGAVPLDAQTRLLDVVRLRLSAHSG